MQIMEVRELKTLYMDNIKQVDTEWTSMFHKVVDEILAPRGYDDTHHSGKRIAKLEFLTEVIWKWTLCLYSINTDQRKVQ